ncbi:MAG: antibiotic biosynthesis monooxygenase [Verrucomicrobiales bacterium]|nr:antibiotic biosynthesis monooxygenase [Verrucomicrobiales bacterium]
MISRIACTAILAAFAMGTSPAQEGKKDPAADIKAQLKDPSKPFTVLVEFHVKPGTEKEFRKAVQNSVRNTRKEPGNAAYSCHQDVKDPTRFVFFEIWRSIPALEEHLGKDYVKTLLGKAEELSAEPPTIRVLTPWVPGPPKEKPAAPAPAAEKTEGK